MQQFDSEIQKTFKTEKKKKEYTHLRNVCTISVKK